MENESVTGFLQSESSHGAEKQFKKSGECVMLADGPEVWFLISGQSD
jgi:hypothetical protein